MLAALGGLLGVGLAWMTIPILASQISFNYIALIDARPDARVLGLALALSRPWRSCWPPSASTVRSRTW